MASGTRQRMVEAASGLLRQGGIGAASFTDVLTASGAARGAIYHHFPAGKSELTREAVVWTGRRVRAGLEALGGTTGVEVVDAFFASIRPVVADAASGLSCAVAVVVVETGQVDAALTEAAHEALQSWVDTLQTRLTAVGTSPDVARALAVSLITFLEGTQVLCRAAGNMSPFDTSIPSQRMLAQVLLAPSR